MNADELFAQAVHLHQAGRLSEAAAGYRHVLAINPQHADALCNLGGAMLDLGDPRAAVDMCRKAIAINPRISESYCNLSNALNTLSRPAEALAVCHQGMAIAPQNAELLNNMGHSLYTLGRLQEALDVYRRAVAVRPDFVMAMCNAGGALARLGRLEEAVEVFRRCLAIRPTHAAAATNLATALNDLARPDEALAAARHAVLLNPKDGTAYNSIGNSLRDGARVEEAIAAYRTAATLNPSDTGFGSNAVYAMEFQPAATESDLLREQRAWNAQHAAPLRSEWKPHTNDRTEDRRLKIGYVSPNFYSHAESFFTVPLLEHHDRTRFEIHCYAAVINADAITQRTQASVDYWHDCRPYRDDELAEKIHGDQIDILVDLSMHMGKHHLLCFARKPAPVQITWLAYPGGTGLDAMDYRITDQYLDPPDRPTNQYTERSIRLQDLWCCYDPLSNTPPAAARDNMGICFGSFNNPCKINEPVVQLWAKLLAAVTDSSIIIQITSEEHRHRVGSIFRSADVAPSRVEFVGRIPRPDYLRLYDRIDICLDPLPYNGITTSCDALWMGVPVVTLRGKTAAGRAGEGILSAIGLTDLIASTSGEFLEIATRLAADRPRLAAMRKTLRQTMANSPIMNAPAFARKMEAAYRQAWIDWCRSN
jgi:predicted O-linked N-acetylglucosamine transferase (SPINDLY family)